jgi:hypothetical protein
MKTTKTTKKTAWQPWNGFAIELTADTQIGLAILQADGRPVAVASTPAEAKEIADSHYKGLLKTDRGASRPDYKLWAQGIDGDYIEVPAFLYKTIR